MTIDTGIVGFIAFGSAFAVAYFIAFLLREFAPQEPSDRINSIDGLRGYLAIAVLVGHFLAHWNYTLGGSWGISGPPIFTNVAPIAVVLFFMITSFLFYGKVLNAPSPKSWRPLYVKRFFRIVPLYDVVILLMIVIIFFHQGAVKVSLPELLISIARWLTFTDLTRTTINGYEPTIYVTAAVTWTLRYEWGFYLLLPAIALYVRYFRVAELRVAGIIAALLAISIASSRFAPITKAIPFLFGMLAVEISTRPSASYFKLPFGAILSLAALCAAIALPGEVYSPWRIAILFAVFLPIALGNDLFGLLITRPSLVLGDCSYSTYLLHGLVLHVLFLAPFISASSTNWILLPIAAAVVSSVSVLSYKFVEVPGIEVGRKISRRY